MINKLYEKIIKFIKDEYKFLIFCVVLLLVGVVRLPINLYVGGGIIDLNQRIVVEDANKEQGSFNLAYVKEVRATIPTYLFSFIANWDRESIKKNQLDNRDSATAMWKREQLYLKEANDNAIINAYRLAKEEITINRELLKVLYVDQNAGTNLMIGDEIIDIEGKSINSYDDLQEAVNGSEIDDKLNISVRRDARIIDCDAKIQLINNEKKIGTYLIKLYDYDLARDIDLKFSNREGGSSGGFMLSLAIYNRLVEEDITHGMKIVGTGTIDIDGNVGEIGGVKYKLKGAVSNKADIFFVPEANYREAMNEKNKHHYTIDIVKVKTLTDAINYLESRS